MSAKDSLLASFAQDLLLKGTTSIPNFLLRSYSKLGISDQEMMLLIQLFHLANAEKDAFPTIEKLTGMMSADQVQIEKSLANLVARKLVRIERNRDDVGTVASYRFEGLFDKLAEIWASEKIKEMEEAKRAAAAQSVSRNKPADNVAWVYKLFEQEFGRPLTPMEGSQIIEWCDGEGHSPELILEALKRAALQGVRNFRYIDSILREWSKQGVRTLREVEVYEERFKEKKATRNTKNIRSKEKGKSHPEGGSEDFRDLYLG